MSTETSEAGRVGRGLGWSTMGNLVLRMGNVLTSIVMARLLAPTEFGVFAVALTVWAILGTLAEFGLGSDLVRGDDLERRAPTVATIGVVTSAVLGLAMVLSAGPLSAAFESPGSRGVIMLMALSLPIFGFGIVPAARLQREYRQKTLMLVNGAGLLTSTVVMTSLAVSGGGAASLAWGQVANQLVIVLGLFAATRTRPHFGFELDLAQRSAAFCLPLAFANLLSWLLLSVDNVVVARVLSPQALGLYVLAFNVSSWPMTAVGAAVRVVALPAFSRAGSDDERAGALVRAGAPLAAVATLMAIGLGTLASPVVVTLYGERWSAAAVALTGLAVFGGIRVMLDLVATFLVASGTTTALLVVQVIWLLAMVPAMLLGVSRWGLAGAAWMHVLVAVVVVLPAYLVCLRRVGVDTVALLRGWVLPLLAAPPAVAAGWWIASRSGPAPVLLILGGLAVLALYALPLASWFRTRIRLLSHRPDPIITPERIST